MRSLIISAAKKAAVYITVTAVTVFGTLTVPSVFADESDGIEITIENFESGGLNAGH